MSATFDTANDADCSVLFILLAINSNVLCLAKVQTPRNLAWKKAGVPLFHTANVKRGVATRRACGESDETLSAISARVV
jgi:hypothetical protein